MNVTELARQLKTTREELLEKLPKLGFDIGGRAIKIDNRIAERIKEAWAKGARTDRLRAKMDLQQQEGEEKEEKKDLQKEIKITEKIAVNDLATKLDTDVTHLIGYLMKNGIMATLNEKIDFDTASIVAEDYGFKAIKTKEEEEKDSKKIEKELKILKADIAKSETGESRPPVVVIMGHVDHGKTSLLDTIRKTNVVEGESGGITQHIGAYQVEAKDRLITFLDTPGHEAFKAMRERGGQVADVAILIVAADDGLKPQTLESINVIQKEELPFVVAINKIDKPGADVDKVKKELAEINLNPEDWGGKTVCVPISAKKGENINDLLDMVLLVSDMEKFTADRNRDACGVIIESHVDRGEGPVATVLINVGTLHVGDEVVIGNTYGKIKALKDWIGKDVLEATPSTPVKILGLKSSPSVGDILHTEKADRSKRKKASKKFRLLEIDSHTADSASLADKSTDSVDEKGENEEPKNSLSIVIKADMLGSLEALIASIKKLEKENIKIDIIKQGLGNITESDLSLAENAGAIVYGFHVQFSPEAQKMSYSRKVEIQKSKIIYEILEDIEKRMKLLVKTKMIEVPQGELLILKVFKDAKAESIIGGRVRKSKISKTAKFRVMRGDDPIDEGSIKELQVNKQEVDEVKEGIECGMKLSGARGIKEGDVLQCYVEEEKEIE